MVSGAVRQAFPGLTRTGAVLVLCLLLASCGIGGDDDSKEAEPTETTASQVEAPPQESGVVASPTTGSTFTLIPATPGESTSAMPTATDVPAVNTAATPAVTPTTVLQGAAQATPHMATPESGSVASGATPEATTAAASNEANSEVTPAAGQQNAAAGTPVSRAEPPLAGAVSGTPVVSAPGESGTAQSTFTGSDGTSGATTLPGSLGTPEAGATPVTAATPERVGARVFSVSGCVVDNPPVYLGSEAQQEVTEELYFRAGPGGDCDLVTDTPLEPGVEVTVLSEPVVRSDSDEPLEWVRVDVDGTTGWVAEEFLAPANP